MIKNFFYKLMHVVMFVCIFVMCSNFIIYMLNQEYEFMNMSLDAFNMIFAFSFLGIMISGTAISITDPNQP